MPTTRILLLTLLAISTVYAEHGSNALPRPALASVTERHALLVPDRRKLKLRSDSALIIDLGSNHTLYAKNSDREMPIASITKLMTAMVVLDARLSPNEKITITADDKDRLKYSRSHLPVGTVLTRGELLHIALMASENRAATALARTYPNGKPAFIKAMNYKAAELGLRHTTFTDPTGLHSGNSSTAEDLARMLQFTLAYPLIQQMTTTPSLVIDTPGKAYKREFKNTNLLIRKRRKNWNIGLSKTGYILEAGRCLVMQADLADRSLLIILLNAWGKYTSIGDSNRIRKWLESATSGDKGVG